VNFEASLGYIAKTSYPVPPHPSPRKKEERKWPENGKD
jgi:hypothetical protein